MGSERRRRWRNSDSTRCRIIKRSRGGLSLGRIYLFGIDQSSLRKRCRISFFTKCEIEEIGNGEEDQKQGQKYVEGRSARRDSHIPKLSSGSEVIVTNPPLASTCVIATPIAAEREPCNNERRQAPRGHRRHLYRPPPRNSSKFLASSARSGRGVNLSFSGQNAEPRLHFPQST